MHIDRTSAAVVVVSPDVAEQLLAAEYAPGMLRKILQELELGIGEIKLYAVELRAVAGLVDHYVAGLDYRVDIARHGGAHGKPEPHIYLGRAGCGEQQVVKAPVG